MARYREPIDEFVSSQVSRRFDAEPHPDAMKIRFRQTLEAVECELRRTFEMLQRWDREGREAQAEAKTILQSVKANNMSWDGLDEDALEKFYSATQGARSATMLCELLAELILLTLDGLLTTLVNELTKKDEPLKIGPEVANGVRLDVLLDAVGNFIRHRNEWRRILREDADFTEKQLRSIRPLARVLTGDANIDGPSAARSLFDVPHPMVAVLDIVAKYAVVGPAVEYRVIHDSVVELGSAIIDQSFAAWYKSVVSTRPEQA